MASNTPSEFQPSSSHAGLSLFDPFGLLPERSHGELKESNKVDGIFLSSCLSPSPDPSTSTSMGNQHGIKTARAVAKEAQEAARESMYQDQCTPRELLIYALPLMKDHLVFLPVTEFEFGKEEATENLLSEVDEASQEDKDSPSGKPQVPLHMRVGQGLASSLNGVQSTMSKMWNSMKESNPGTFKKHVHDAASSVLENMFAEERLMKNIPKHVTKIVVIHPSCIDPLQVQEQLNNLTASFCMRSMGKAVLAGIALPVAIGIEALAVPGVGWLALYQLYKSSVSVAGGQRLKAYLSHGSADGELVRVNYVAESKLDLFVDRAALNPDGILTCDDVDDLCFDLMEPHLHHNLSELRKRYIARHVKAKSGGYALLPVNSRE